MAWQNIHTHPPQAPRRKARCIALRSLCSALVALFSGENGTHILCCYSAVRTAPSFVRGVGLVALQPIDVRCRPRRGWFACQAAAGGRHTILLIQMTERASTRTYHDYDTMGRAWDGV